MSDQLALGLDEAIERRYLCCGAPCSGGHAEGCTNPNLRFFRPDGSPAALMWCSDTVRIAWRRGVELECPNVGRPDKVPPEGCCKTREPIGG